MKVQLLLLSSFFILFISCTESVDYQYKVGLNKYLLDEFNIELRAINDEILYFLPINECSTCKGTSLQLKMFSELQSSKNITLVIIGLIKDSRFADSVNDLQVKKLFDADSNIIIYPTGVSKPLLLHVKNGKVKYFIKVDDFKINDAKQYITNHNN